MAAPLCPKCGTPMVVGARIAGPSESRAMPFPAPAMFRLLQQAEEDRAVWVCPGPGCVEQAVQRVY